MANKNNRFDENQSGKFYVDRTCVCCDLCFENAPKNFVQASETSDRHSHVKKQPESSEEVEAVKKAIEWCPVNAIGDDGQDNADAQLS